jgi:hypothetical protein
MSVQHTVAIKARANFRSFYRAGIAFYNDRDTVVDLSLLRADQVELLRHETRDPDPSRKDPGGALIVTRGFIPHTPKMPEGLAEAVSLKRS